MNEQIQKLYLDYIEEKSRDKDSNQVGPFYPILMYGSDMLFIGQNYGAPLDDYFSHKSGSFEGNHNELMQFLEDSWTNSRFGGFVFKIVDRLNLDFYKNASFTNLAIWATKGNVFPKICENDLEFLKKQIDTICPKLIVFLSSGTKNYILKNSPQILQNVPWISYKHPVTEYYSDDYASKISKDILNCITLKA